MSEHSINVKNPNINEATPLEKAQYAMVSLKKAEQYLTFFNTLDTGVDFSDNVIKDIQMRQRAIQHRIDVLEVTGKEKAA